MIPAVFLSEGREDRGGVRAPLPPAFYTAVSVTRSDTKERWWERRRSSDPVSVFHASKLIVPVIVAACAVWPVASALFFPAAIVTQVQAIVDSSVWAFYIADYKGSCFTFPEVYIMPIVGNFAHAGWIVLCSLRGDFQAVDLGWAVLASFVLLLLYGVMAVLTPKYAYALTPVELVIVVFFGSLVAFPATLYAFQN